MSQTEVYMIVGILGTKGTLVMLGEITCSWKVYQHLRIKRGGDNVSSLKCCLLAMINDGN